MEEVLEYLKVQDEKRSREREEDNVELTRKIREGVKQELNDVMKPWQERTEKVEKRADKMEDNLKKLVSDISSIKEQLATTISTPTARPVSSWAAVTQQQSVQTGAGGVRLSVESYQNQDQASKDQEEIRKIFKMSNQTLGLSPIAHNIVEAEVQRRVAENGEERESVTSKVMKEAVEEYLVMEMKVKKEYLEKLNIVGIFAPQKREWNTLYVQLESKEQADWVLHHKQWMVKPVDGQVMSKVVKYVPRQLYDRWDAIQAMAFNIRQAGNKQVQTNVGHGTYDFFLQTRNKGERVWGEYWKLPDTLPKVVLRQMEREVRSPASAPGREQYMKRTEKRKERPSRDSNSSSSSPPQKQANGDRSSDLNNDLHPPGSSDATQSNNDTFSHLNNSSITVRSKAGGK